MNWSLTDPPLAGVDFPDGLASQILDAINVGGEFPLDEYAKSFISPERIPGLLVVLQSASERRKEQHRIAIRQRLHLVAWQPWATPVLEAALRSDPVLKALDSLATLASQALKRGTGITHNVD